MSLAKIFNITIDTLLDNHIDKTLDIKEEKFKEKNYCMVNCFYYNLFSLQIISTINTYTHSIFLVIQIFIDVKLVLYSLTSMKIISIIFMFNKLVFYFLTNSMLCFLTPTFISTVILFGESYLFNV